MMKKTIILSFLIFLTTSLAVAQVKLGAMTSLSHNSIPTGEILINTSTDSTQVSITSTKPIWYLGPYFRFQANGIYLQSGVLVGFSSIFYDIDDLKTGEQLQTNQREAEWNFSIPIELGVKLNDKFSISAGVLGTNHFVEEEINPLLAVGNTLGQIFTNRRLGYRISLTYDNDWLNSFSISYNRFPNDIPTTIILNNNIRYTSNIKRQQLMINFSWNFIREGWED